jgi:hypothetical protein
MRVAKSVVVNDSIKMNIRSLWVIVRGEAAAASEGG